MKTPAKIRSLKTSDLGFIIETWLKGYRDSRFGAPIDPITYHGEMRKVIIRVLEKATPLIACAEDDDDQIFGGLVHRIDGDMNILSWIYVKPVFRKLGIGHKLLEQAGRVTHCTCISKNFQTYQGVVNPWLTHIKYNPFLDLTIGTQPIKDRRE